MATSFATNEHGYPLLLHIPCLLIRHGADVSASVSGIGLRCLARLMLPSVHSRNLPRSKP
jgi:hypothetical protein